MNESLTLAYLAMAMILGWTLFSFIQRSELGVWIAYAEFFVFVGAFLYPGLYYAGLVSPAMEGSGFLSTTGEPGIASALHVGCYLTGSICGIALANRTTGNQSVKVTHAMAGRLIRDERAFFTTGLFLGLGALVLFLSLVGWKDAIVYAAAWRAGDFSDIDAGTRRLLFLKSLAFAFTFIVCFAPAILRQPNSRVLIVLYVAFAVLLYVVSVSRTVVLLMLAVPLLIYARVQTRSIVSFVGWCCLLIPLLLLFMFYGKPFGFLLYTLLTDEELVSIEPYLAEHGMLAAFFGNFEHYWFSIEAGVRHFAATEKSLLPMDVVLAAMGFVPSWVLTQLGMEHLDYRAVAAPLSCINSAYFGLQCTVPPRDIGMTAYMLPGGGAFVLAVIKYYVYRRCEKMFLYTASVDYGRTWYPLMVILFMTMFFSFVPKVVSDLAFILICLTTLAALLTTLRYLSTHRRLRPL